VKKIALVLTMLALFPLGISMARAEGYPWKAHDAPFDFLFGNDIDQHQQTRVTAKGKLAGFLYITYTGAYTDGYPDAQYGQDTVGWLLQGIPISATLVADGVNPVWCVDPADLPAENGYTHFHWLGSPLDASGLVVGVTYNGFLLKLTARDAFFFGGFVVRPGIDAYSHDNIVTSCSG
jgi:hypothetical protein